MEVRAEELRHGVKSGTAEGTSIDNHHAIPRPDYDSWSSPGNMPGNGHDIGSEERTAILEKPVARNPPLELLVRQLWTTTMPSLAISTAAMEETTEKEEVYILQNPYNVLKIPIFKFSVKYVPGHYNKSEELGVNVLIALMAPFDSFMHLFPELNLRHAIALPYPRAR
ncbi:hypothetical protein EJB05_47373, partial [Eragrostis curvula]